MINLQKFFNELTTRYKADLADYKSRVEAINEELSIVREAALSSDATVPLSGPVPDHSATYYYGLLRQLEEEMSKKDEEYNTALHTTLQAAVDSLKGMTSTRQDHQIRLQNALSYISMVGDKLQDEQAWGLISPLFGDYSTMENLSLVLSDREGLSITNTALSGYVAVVYGLKMNMEESEFMFNHGGFSRNPYDMQIRFDFIDASLATADENTAFTDRMIKMTFADAKRAVGLRLYNLEETYRHANM